MVAEPGNIHPDDPDSVIHGREIQVKSFVVYAKRILFAPRRKSKAQSKGKTKRLAGPFLIRQGDHRHIQAA
jgi:hypothetical protein